MAFDIGYAGSFHQTFNGRTQLADYLIFPVGYLLEIYGGHFAGETLHRFNLVGFMAERLGGNTATVETCAASM